MNEIFFNESPFVDQGHLYLRNSTLCRACNISRLYTLSISVICWSLDRNSRSILSATNKLTQNIATCHQQLRNKKKNIATEGFVYACLSDGDQAALKVVSCAHFKMFRSKLPEKKKLGPFYKCFRCKIVADWSVMLKAQDFNPRYPFKNRLCKACLPLNSCMSALPKIVLWLDINSCQRLTATNTETKRTVSSSPLFATLSTLRVFLPRTRSYSRFLFASLPTVYERDDQLAVDPESADFWKDTKKWGEIFRIERKRTPKNWGKQNGWQLTSSHSMDLFGWAL